jgi:signal transduction histidine kinase
VKPSTDRLLDGAVPLLAGAFIVAGVAFRADPSTRPLAIALGAGAAATLVLYRRAPIAALALAGAFVLALVAIDARAGAVAVIAPAIALYSLALTRGRRALAAAVFLAAVAVLVVDIAVPGNHHHALTLQSAGHVALVAIPVLAAEAHRNRRAYVRVLEERVQLAERTREDEARRRAEQERRRIARDLHDVVAHTLTTINVHAGVAAHCLDASPGPARDTLASIEAASHEALQELRVILGVLREPEDGAPPLEPIPNLTALDALLEQARATGIHVQLDVMGEQPQRVPGAVQLAAYRIIQESLTNVRRHAPAASTCVSIAYSTDHLRVEIANDVVTSRNGNGSTPGVGILGMRERATALGGTLQAGRSGASFQVVGEIPYRPGT